ncbi:MAG TPA: hypothetical protein VH764_08685 [Gemmatimonadales bacterium]|jgi:alpha-tubulin suppressor-like RCC1 family protein
MGSVSRSGRVLWAGLLALVGCQSDAVLAPAGVGPAAAVGEFGAITGGGRHGCVQRFNASTGASLGTFCWGADERGQQGDGGAIPEGNNLRPTLVSSSGTFRQLAAGENFTCALPNGGGVPRCWGDNNRGQLGNNSRTASAVPVPVTMPAGISSFIKITAGKDHACALTAGGAGFCWGGNTYGQVGNSTNVDQLRPVPIFNGRTWHTITAGGEFTCAVQVSPRAAWCWGLNTSAQYGIGDANARWWYPHNNVHGGHLWEKMEAGGKHVCGITTSQKMYCWGAYEHGQLGADLCPGDGLCLPGGTHADPSPTYGNRNWLDVDLGDEHTCAIEQRINNEVYCWGRGTEGQLGNGAYADVFIPTWRAGMVQGSSIEAGANFSVAQTVTGTIVTWGLNGNGQLGNGTTTTRNTPLQILP